MSRLYGFGPYRFDPRARVLHRGAEDTALPPKAAETLLALLRTPGEVVEKDELLKNVWSDTVVGEGSLTRTISILRKALGSTGDGGPYIATVSKRGYRFIAPVTSLEEQPLRSGEPRLMLAVLPFANPAGGREEDFFSDGLTEEMITRLSRLNPARLGVIARTSAMRFKGSDKSIRQIGMELGVAFLMAGSVRRAGGRVRIASQLIQVSDESAVWAQSYERTLEDIWKLQSEVARAIAREVQVKLSPGQERVLAEAGEVSPEAYEAYLRGRFFLNKRTEEGMRRSIDHYRQAIRQQPGYAAAHAGVADAYTMLACRGMVPARETLGLAKRAAEKALELDGELGEAHGSLAHVRLHLWEWEGLDEQFRRALDLSPAQAIFGYWYAEYLMSRGRPDEAVALAERAHRTDPLSPVVSSALAMVLYLARRYDDAVGVLERAREIDDGHFLLHLRLGLVRIQQGKFSEAVSEMKRAVQLAAESTETLAALALAYAAAGEIRQARRLVAKLMELSGTHYVLPYNLAKVHAVEKESDQAIRWLQTAYEEANPDLIELNSEPIFDGIRADPRFREIERRVQRLKF
jgi:TolB-like protein/Flp pilus assembly protein TadD